MAQGVATFDVDPGPTSLNVGAHPSAASQRRTHEKLHCLPCHLNAMYAGLC